MHYRPLGKTGLSVSVLSQGGAAIGQQYGPVSAAEAAECVHSAIDAGVNLIDTAAYYGKGQSEKMLGEILQGGWREKVPSAPRPAGSTARCSTSPRERKWFEESLKRLRTDHVDILLAHDIEFATDYDYVFNETANVLQQLKKEGKTRFIGMSCYPLGLLRQAIERCDLDVVISYAHYSLQNTRLLTELLPVAEAKGVGVLNASPLSLGLFTNQGPPPWHPAPQEVKDACRRAAEQCRARRGHRVPRHAILFRRERIPSTITGTARRDELAVNFRAMTEPIDSAILADVQRFSRR